MSKDQLNPELLTVCGLFDHDTVYTVPIYQRNYAWRIEQIEQLVSDIQDAVVRSESATATFSPWRMSSPIFRVAMAE